MEILVKVLKSEMLKLKGTKIVYIVPFLTIATVLLVYFMYLFNPKYSIDRTGWDEYYMAIYIIINMMTGISMYYILTGYIFSREYQDNMDIVLFTSFIPKHKFLIGKFLIILGFIILSMIIVLFLPFLLGLTISNEPFTIQLFSKQLKTVLLMAVMHFCLIPIGAYVSIKWKNMLSVVLLLVTILFLNLILINAPINTLFPWSVPFTFSPNEAGRTFTNYPLGISTLIFTFILGCVLCRYEFYRKS